MNFNKKYIDELIYLRDTARKRKNWVLSDEIRDYLDSKFCFAFDTEEGQVIYHRTSGTRQELITELKNDLRSVKIFKAWLVSTLPGIRKKN